MCVGVESSGLAAGDKSTGAFATSGGALSIASGRLSYTLGLVGPCYSIDTACASALAALHVCASAVGAGECEDGVTVGTKVLSEAGNHATSAGGMTSPLGRCHTFDQRADGYCRGEGCGAFLLTGRSSGEDDEMGVAAVRILGSAVQQDGPSASLTAPNGSSQKRLIETVRRAIGGSEGVPSLEAHGTGTALGDPIEVVAAAHNPGALQLLVATHAYSVRPVGRWALLTGRGWKSAETSRHVLDQRRNALR